MRMEHLMFTQLVTFHKYHVKDKKRVKQCETYQNCVKPLKNNHGGKAIARQLDNFPKNG